MKLSVTGLTALVFVLWIARPSEAGGVAPADNATPILRTPTFLDYLHSEQPGEDKLLYGGAEYDAMTEGIVTLHGLRELQGALDPEGFDSILELVQRRGWT